MIHRLLAASLVALVAATLSASPAQAAPSQPGAPYAVATSTTSVTLTWPASRGATRYQVFWSTSYSGVKSLSSPSRRTKGSTPRLTMTGLKPGRMYCFMVRGTRGTTEGRRSVRHCKSTMRRANRTTHPTASVATFNVCAAASGCRSWASRESAIVSRILDASADVVAIQEGSGRIDDLDRRLVPHGYALAAQSGTEAVFYRSARFSPVTTEVCEDDQPDEEPGPTCTDVPRRGSWYLGNNATAAWADLRLRANGKPYLFTSAHLTNGKTTTASAKRRTETTRLVVAALQASGDRNRTVLAGDFNSTRNRPDDSPRIRLAQSAFFDAYDRSATFSRPQYNSYNGYDTTPTRSVTYGDHVDRIFLPDAIGSTSWRVVVRLSSGRYTTPMASDHSPVRATLYLG